MMVASPKFLLRNWRNIFFALLPNSLTGCFGSTNDFELSRGMISGCDPLAGEGLFAVAFLLVGLLINIIPPT